MNETNFVSRDISDDLFKATGWEPSAWWARSNYNGEWTVVPSKEHKAHEFSDEPGAGQFYDHKPAYSLLFVINKLPERDELIKNTAMLGRSTDNKGWACVWRDIVCISELPQDAIAGLLFIGVKRGWIIA